MPKGLRSISNYQNTEVLVPNSMYQKSCPCHILSINHYHTYYLYIYSH